MKGWKFCNRLSDCQLLEKAIDKKIKLRNRIIRLFVISEITIFVNIREYEEECNCEKTNLTFQSPTVTICITRFKISKYAFYPHSAFMSSECFSE
jgi:hypothetical protein